MSKAEIWKRIEGFDSCYFVSNFGRVKSVRFYKTKGISVENMFIPQKLPSGHLQVVLRNNGKSKPQRVHRLVAKAFIPNPLNLPCINHKDENPSNNFVFINEDGSIDYEKSNLEWCTQEYNCNYGTRNQRLSIKNRNNSFRSKPIEQYDLKGMYVGEYPSIMEASRVLNLRPSGIGLCCNGKYATCGGFQWKFKNSEKVILNIDKKIIQYNKLGEIIDIYNTVKDASVVSKVSYSSILNCLSGLSKSAGGFVWKKEICK